MKNASKNEKTNEKDGITITQESGKRNDLRSFQLLYPLNHTPHQVRTTGDEPQFNGNDSTLKLRTPTS